MNAKMPHSAYGVVYAECRIFIMLSGVMLSFLLLSIVYAEYHVLIAMLRVVMISAIAIMLNVQL
jgi:hypothetical protein